MHGADDGNARTQELTHGTEFSWATSRSFELFLSIEL